ncbi:hypothetical protein LINPERHAP1_LOCUS4881 [Linum perenne]
MIMVMMRRMKKIRFNSWKVCLLSFSLSPHNTFSNSSMFWPSVVCKMIGWFLFN